MKRPTINAKEVYNKYIAGSSIEELAVENRVSSSTIRRRINEYRDQSIRESAEAKDREVPRRRVEPPTFTREEKYYDVPVQDTSTTYKKAPCITRDAPSHPHIVQRPLEPFDIVVCPYSDLNAVVKQGLFLVGYLEREDSNDYNKRNIVGYKITSQDGYASKHRLHVKREDALNLHKDSFIYANKPTALVESKCRLVSTLKGETREKIYTLIREHCYEVQSQMLITLLRGVGEIKEIKHV